MDGQYSISCPRIERKYLESVMPTNQPNDACLVSTTIFDKIEALAIGTAA